MGTRMSPMPKVELVPTGALCRWAETRPAIHIPGHADAEGGPTAGPRGVREVAPRGQKRARHRRRSSHRTPTERQCSHP